MVWLYWPLVLRHCLNKLKRLLHSKITSILRDQAWFIMKYPTLIMAKLSTFVFVYNFCHCQRCQILNFVKVTKTGIFEKHLTVKIVKISGNAVQSTGQTTHKFTMQDQNNFRKIKKTEKIIVRPCQTLVWLYPPCQKFWILNVYVMIACWFLQAMSILELSHC